MSASDACAGKNDGELCHAVYLADGAFFFHGLPAATHEVASYLLWVGVRGGGGMRFYETGQGRGPGRG